MSMTIGNNIGINNSYQNSTGKTSEYKSVREYSNYLMDKYDCLSSGNVSVTPGLLRKAMNDEETGNWLERELGNVPSYIQKAQQSAKAHGSTLKFVSIEFGEEYSTMTTIGVFGDDGKSNSVMDKWLEKIKENKEQETEKYSYTFKGADGKSVTDSFIKQMSALQATMRPAMGFDIKV